jgi:dienelactone hydrolase
MKKVWFLGAIALGAAACTPDIAKDAPPTNPVVVAEFDPSASPPVVPTPNDLALNTSTGLVNAPVNPASPAAEQEFTRDYVNTLNGFPVSVSASTTVKDLDPTSVNGGSVKLIDLYEGTPLSRPVPRDIVIGYNEDTDRINVIAPTGWPKGGRYAVVLVGGDNGLKSTAGEKVVPSATWAFASSPKPLVTCQDLTAPDCRATTEIIPSLETDPALRIEDQTRTALLLEQLRRGYAPVLDLAASKFSVKREDILLMWTFTVMNHPEATFDPAASIIPFPNDLLRIPATDTAPARLNLPVPTGPNANPLEVALITGLNTLDGWSTTAPIVSENGAATGAIDLGSELDINTVKLGQTLLFIKTTNTDKGTRPQVKACLNCASSLKPDGSAPTSPQQLQIVPEVPLDESTQYAVVMLRGMKDIKGRTVVPNAVQALLRSSAPLVDANGKSQVAAVPDVLAARLEPARQGMKGLYDALEAQGIKRKDVNLAWAFTTQSTRSVLERLKRVPEQLNVPADPQYLKDKTSEIKQVMMQGSLDNASVGRVFVGGFLSPYLLNDPRGVLNPTTPRIDRIPFMLFLPSTPAPMGGYPVVIFGHGLTGNHTNVLAVANTLNANGFAVAAMDTVFHGDRTTCAGLSPQSPFVYYGDPQNPFVMDAPDKACADGTCDVTANSPTYGRCVKTMSVSTCDPRPTSTDPSAVHGDLLCASLGQGRCMATGKCEGGRFLGQGLEPTDAPVMGGWNFLNLANQFATRDNFRHHVVDFAQFTRMLGSDGINSRLTAAGAGTLNGTTVDYVGASLGGLQGTLSASVSERMRRVVLNVTGGGLVDVLLTATNPPFKARRESFLAQLKSAGLEQGTPKFDEFMNLIRTILDPADARNYGYFLENAPSQPPGREAFIQFIKDDNVIPNPTTRLLRLAANRPGQSNRVVDAYMHDYPLPVDIKHGFLAIYDPLNGSNPALKAIRDAAQGQVADFLKTGVVTNPAPEPAQ